jgi:protein gp37
MANRLLYMFEANCGEDGQSTWAEYSDVTAGGRWNGRTAFVSNALKKPLHWKKPAMIFVCSMGDILHESVHHGWLHEVLNVIHQTPQHTYQILTKRPERFFKYEWKCSKYGWDYSKQLPKNVWFGVTAENQEQADKRIPILLEIPAVVRFVSVEPMLERIDIYQYLGGKRDIKPPHKYNGGIDWVIVGCESGHHRRPFVDSWASGLITECRNAGVPVFVKQVSISGKASKEPSEWPEYIQVREFPKAR